jgi:hypothetical protein
MSNPSRGAVLGRFVVRFRALGASLAAAGLAIFIGCMGGDVAPETEHELPASATATSSAIPSSAGPGSSAALPAVANVSDDDPKDSESGAASDLAVTRIAFGGGQEASESAKSVTFDDIKFEMKKDEKFKQRMLTEKITELFGKNIRIRGYILPSFKQNGLTQFVLVRDNMECCFGPGAALFDCIIVQMVEGHTASFSVRPVTVEGKFSFQKLELDGTLHAIYHLDGVSVK